MEEREVLVVPAETNELTLEVLAQLMETMNKMAKSVVGLAEQIEKVVESHDRLVTMLTADERRELVRIYENAEKFKIIKLTVEIAERLMEKELNIYPDCEAEFQYDEDGDPYIFVKYWVDGFYFNAKGRLPEMTAVDPRITTTFARKIRAALLSHGYDYAVVKTIGNKDDKLGLNKGGVVKEPENWSGEW